MHIVEIRLMCQKNIMLSIAIFLIPFSPISSKFFSSLYFLWTLSNSTSAALCDVRVMKIVICTWIKHVSAVQMWACIYWLWIAFISGVPIADSGKMEHQLCVSIKWSPKGLGLLLLLHLNLFWQSCLLACVYLS